jgi:hypothetical protein
MIGPAGTSYIDPVFGTKITRITDEAFSASIGTPGQSWSTGSGSEQNTFASDRSAFIVEGLNGAVWVPFSANGAKIPTPDFYWLPLNGPAFSYNDPTVLYGRSRDDRSLCKYGLYTQQLTKIVDFPNLVSGEVSPSANDRIATFGKGGQDTATEVYVWDGSRLHVLDTVTGKVDGVAIISPGMVWGIGVHNVRIDKSGRFVVITTAELLNKPASPIAIWDLEQDAVWSLESAFSGHKVGGFGTLINQDVAPDTQWDDMQFVIRNLDRSDVQQNLIFPLLEQKLSSPLNGQDSHLSWNNHQGGYEPVLVSAYRNAGNTEPWRPWVNELLLIATDGSGTVYRVCHHRSVYKDFWDGPHAIISPDGTQALFTSNMGESLGQDEFGGFRKDVFRVELKQSVTSPIPAPSPIPTPTPTPTPSPTPEPAIGALKTKVPWGGKNESKRRTVAREQRGLGWYFYEDEFGEYATFVYTGVKLP